MTCSGSKSGEKCGGYNRISVYYITGKYPSPSPSYDPYVGCYKDRRSHRAMPDYKYTDSKMTNQVGLRWCPSRCRAR